MSVHNMIRVCCCLIVVYFTQSVFVSGKHYRNGVGASSNKLFCYYVMPSTYNGTFPTDLNATICTHLLMISVTTDGNFQLTAGIHDKFIQDTVPILRKLNPALTILLSNSDGGGGFTEILASAENRISYMKSAVPFLRKYGVDGLDLDWEYPTLKMKFNFSLVIASLQDIFIEEARKTKLPKLLLTSAVSGNEEQMKIYDYGVMAKSLDYVIMMGYDFHGYSTGRPYTDYNSPLNTTSLEKKDEKHLNLDWATKEWLRQGVSPNKYILGVPLYGRTFTLKFPKEHGQLAQAVKAGECDGCGYNWACDALTKKNATRVFDTEAMVPYAYYGNQWISYDDVESLSIKTKYAIKNNLGGMMVWHMASDDVYGQCKSSERRFPLLTVISSLLLNTTG